MSIVLATAPDEDSPWNQASFPPLGLLYIASGVKKALGIDAVIADTYAEGLTADEAVASILARSPEIVGITFTSSNVKETCDLLAALKQANPNIVTACGGIHATIFDELLLKEVPHLDFVLRGEGDFSFAELCGRLQSGRDFAGVPGLSYRSNGEIVRGVPQQIEDLDDIPIPDRRLLKPGLYGTQWYGFKLPDLGGLVTTAFSSRGCPFACTFCSMVHFCGGKYRARSAKNVFEELRQVREEGYELVIFFDDNLTADRTRVHELCERVIDAKLGLRFGFAGTLHALPEATLRLMQRAGFDLVFIGAESGSNKVLSYYKKPARRQNVAAGIERAKKAHMFTIASFIAGAPVETDEDFQETLNFVREVRPNYCDINPLMVHPGSSLWEDLGGSGPDTIEDSVSKAIWRVTDRVQKSLVQKRMREFKQTFSETADFKRSGELLGFLIYNKTVRRFVWLAMKNFRLIRQISHTGVR